ncbi:hypothetical protein JOC47_001690 [Halanaerobacter jeridensis]|uniref:Uncharacterized protein n=1 Tax=Halanaerobacter jeridensis TaxID=706427 RepID=A0A939BQY8_9FIRM|nr:hypothetical protein [Halanaerobacter jeridensis]
MKLILFFSSYAPLFLIFSIKNSFDSNAINLILIVVSIFSIIVLWVFIYSYTKIESDYINIEEVNPRDGEATSYIVTYIIPFLSMDLTTFEDKSSLLILFLVLGIIYINSNMIYINPLLNLAGYHIFETKDKSGNTLILISRSKFISAGNRIKAIKISSNVYLEED